MHATQIGATARNLALTGTTAGWEGGAHYCGVGKEYGTHLRINRLKTSKEANKSNFKILSVREKEYYKI